MTCLYEGRETSGPVADGHHDTHATDTACLPAVTG
jgi:hypothetical protein